jgi:hypothetical protein
MKKVAPSRFNTVPVPDPEADIIETDPILDLLILGLNMSYSQATIETECSPLFAFEPQTESMYGFPPT